MAAAAVAGGTFSRMGGFFRTRDLMELGQRSVKSGSSGGTLALDFLLLLLLLPLFAFILEVRSLPSRRRVSSMPTY